MIDQRFVKLGRKAVKTDTRTLCLGRYLTSALAAPPSAVDWTGGVTSWGMMLNGPDPNNPKSAPNGLGDCTIAGAAHAIQVWTMNTGTMVTLPDAIILDAYHYWDGYVLNNPNTDNGGVEIDVLNTWRHSHLPFPFAQHQLLAYADPNVTDLTEVRQGIQLFGGLYIGLALPLSAQNQSVWDVVGDGKTGNSAPGSWGGHCVFVPKYDQNGFTCITWGGVQRMTTAFWNTYCDEAHALLNKSWLGAHGLAPAGFDQAQLQADLGQIV